MGLLRRARGWVPRGELKRGVLTLFAGTTIAQGIAVASAPILTRLYSPSEVGTYSVAISILAILITVSCLSYQFAIPLPEDDVAAANVLALCLLTTLVMSAGAAVVLWLAGPELLRLLGAAELRPYVLLIALGQIGGAFVAALTYWAVRTRKFSAIAATNLTQSGTLVAVQVGLGVVGLGAVGLLLGDVAGRFSGSIRLARAAWRTHADAFRHVTRPGIRGAAVRYRRFAILSTPSSIVTALGLQAPLLLLVALYGTDVGGKYALADRICGLPVTLLAAAVARVYFSEAARVARDQPAALRDLFARTTVSLARAAIAPFALLAVLAPLLAGPIFGADWAEVGLYVAILAPMFYVVLVASPTSSTLDVLERQDLQLVLGVLRLALTFGAIVLASATDLPPAGAVAVISIAGCLTYALYGLGSWWAILNKRPPGAVIPPATRPRATTRRVSRSHDRSAAGDWSPDAGDPRPAGPRGGAPVRPGYGLLRVARPPPCARDRGRDPRHDPAGGRP